MQLKGYAHPFKGRSYGARTAGEKIKVFESASCLIR